MGDLLSRIDLEALLEAALPVGIALVVLAAIVVVAVIVAKRVRRGKRAQERAAAELAAAGAKLVELDDAAAAIDLELGLSTPLYGGTPPASLRRARLTAQHSRDDAFAAYRTASAEGRHPAEVRREARRLSRAIDEALRITSAAREENAAWVDENASPESQIDLAQARIDELRELMGDPAALRVDLERIADESEWDDAAHADERAHEAIEEAEDHWNRALAAIGDPSASVREALADMERALVRAGQSAQLLEETHRLVTGAAQAIGDEEKAARSAIRAAEGTLATLSEDDAPRLAEAIRVADSALEQAMRVAERRPVTANERIARLRHRLDIALGDSRTQQQRLRGARSALPGSLSAARSALARAESIVLDAELDARVRLDSARHELAAARQAHDPIEALEAARRATRDAEEAAVLARFRKRRR
ncbi:hypothetical protein [Microbacterium sp. gxy059]|uniref:hypothetical protein n=1 Tax=Microbacterium sp. gxy059 TaxID=2957199 RepID=UPI003D98FB1D